MLATLLLTTIFAPLATYADPGGAFALDLPTGWTARKQDLGDGVTFTETFKQGDEEGAHIDILVQKSAADIAAKDHPEVNKGVLDIVVQLLGAEGTITRQSRNEVTFDNRKAMRMEIDFRDEDDVTWKGWVIAVCGKNHALALIAYAKSSDTATYKLVDQHANTLAVESKTPGKGGASPGGGLLSKTALSNIAGKIKSNMKREPMDKVLVAGTPPLTYGSVANFVTVIELLFDVQLTEAEFDATRERFLEYYEKADAEGKKILAEQGASLLKTLTTGTKAEIEQSRSEGKAVFENAFQRGSQMGIGYATVMWEAISRRQAKLATTKQAPKKEDWDQEITEGDLDATMEMLYFMWVGAGRDASDVTMDDVIKIRNQIVQGLPEMDPQLQLLIANAPKVYAGLRQQWQAASGAQRLAMAQQFGAALDEWGIGAQSSFEQSSGGGSGEYSMNAQIAQNTAWNAAKTWSSSN